MTGKRKQFTVLEKITIIDRIDKGEKNCNIAKEFGVSHTTISTILKQRSELTKCLDNNETKKKRIRHSTMQELDTRLLKWYMQHCSSNISINSPMLKSKADEIANELGIERNVSTSWIQRFRARHQINFEKIKGEHVAVANRISESWLRDVWPHLCADYCVDDIFNACETGLIYNLPPVNGIKEENCSDDELPRHRLIAMIAANMSGTLQKRLLVIGTPKIASNLENDNKLPVDYYSSTKALMTSGIFERWLVEWDSSLTKEGKKICLIIDNCPAHPHVKNLKSIKLVFLPPNVTPALQPMHQGVIHTLKSHFRNSQTTQYFRNLENAIHKKFNILDAILTLAEAWNDVNPALIENCFRRAGFMQFLIADSTETLDSSFDEFNTGGRSRILENSLYEDEDLNVTEQETESNADNVNDNDENDDSFSIPSAAQACQAVETLQKFACFNDIGGDGIFSTLSFLRKKCNIAYMNSQVIQSGMTKLFHDQ